MKPLRPLKKWILFHLEIQRVLFGRDAEMSYDQLYWRVPAYLESSIRVSMQSLIQDGFVTAYRRDGRFLARISSAGTLRLQEYFNSKIWQSVGWSSTFWFCVPQLEYSAKQLRENPAYGRLGGVFLLAGTPGNLERIPNVLYIETARLTLETGLDLIDRGWSLEELAKSYSPISGQLARLLASMKDEKALSHNTKQQIQAITKRLFSVLEKDPTIPPELLPAGYAGPSVVQMYLEVMRIAADRERGR